MVLEDVLDVPDGFLVVVDGVQNVPNASWWVPEGF